MKADGIVPVAMVAMPSQVALDELQARIKRLEKDVARYRWLRTMIYDDTIIVNPNRMLHGKALDAAIDAAIEAGK